MMIGHDRAARVATAILQAVEGALRAALHGDDVGAPRAAIEGLLRDEFDDVRNTTLSEILPQDE